MPGKRKAAPLLAPEGPFVAIDFETADYGSDSACAVALVRVEERRIVHREVALIRPPRSRILFTHIHGITWAKVAQSPLFAEIWPKVQHLLEGAVFLAAHNAPFDRTVLHSCCTAAGLSIPTQPFLCTVQIARRRWGLKPNNLPSVCRRLGIGLIHHDPLSDAEACASILLAATDKQEAPSLPITHQPTGIGSPHAGLRSSADVPCSASSGSPAVCEPT
jgi:DNA polymerase-3 subunit epsilon